eukprot:COSAG01_NODE_11029_length_2023_cov_121.533784_3_plen_280_part_00
MVATAAAPHSAACAPPPSASAFEGAPASAPSSTPAGPSAPPPPPPAVAAAAAPPLSRRCDWLSDRRCCSTRLPCPSTKAAALREASSAVAPPAATRFASASTSCSQNGYLSSRGGCQTPLTFAGDHGDPTASRLDSPSAGSSTPRSRWRYRTPAVRTATYRVAVGIKTAGILWEAATTATQQLAVWTHLPQPLPQPLQRRLAQRLVGGVPLGRARVARPRAPQLLHDLVLQLPDARVQRVAQPGAPVGALQSERPLIESRRVSKPLAFARKLRPRRPNS